jgi:hypothetical protein
MGLNSHLGRSIVTATHDPILYEKLSLVGAHRSKLGVTCSAKQLVLDWKMLHEQK